MQFLIIEGEGEEYLIFVISPMAKKICLFVWFKRLFDSEGKPRTEKV